MGVRYKPTSHETFSHENIESYGYDWERIANPAIAPRHPAKIYLPRSTEDIAAAVRETRRLGQELRVRSKGHSSNDLVLTDGGAVLSLELLDRILQLDPTGMTVTVQAGVTLSSLDENLAREGYGLPIVGDHDHITAGGFAAVGGVSPASHVHGLFVDNIERVEYVTWDGEVVRCSRHEDPETFLRVLGSTGRHGVLSLLTLRIIRVDKHRSVLRNHYTHHRKLETFLEAAVEVSRNPNGCGYQRAMWVDKGKLAFGRVWRFHETTQGQFKRFWSRAAYWLPYRIGHWAGRMPDRVDRLFKMVGFATVMLTPRYTTIKSVERFTDKVLDYTVGDPTRMLVLFSPEENFKALFREVYALSKRYRERGALTLLVFNVKAIRSGYLAGHTPGKRFCEIGLVCGIDNMRMTPELMEQLVSELDDLCIQQGAFRYMHTKTVKDEARRAKIDPSHQYEERAEAPQEEPQRFPAFDEVAASAP